MAGDCGVPSVQTWFHLASKEPAEYNPVKFRTSTFNMFHHINSYEEQGCIVVDLCTWKGWVPLWDRLVWSGLCLFAVA